MRPAANAPFEGLETALPEARQARPQERPSRRQPCPIERAVSSALQTVVEHSRPEAAGTQFQSSPGDFHKIVLVFF